MTRPTSTEDRQRAQDVLERAASAFEDELWESAIGQNVRGWLGRWGISDATLREFGVGYAPGKTSWLLSRLEDWELEQTDLVGAGLATHSRRGAVHVWFHARVMFPIREPDGELSGFAGLATHLGPSWPLWLTSPDAGPFDAGVAMFAADRARAGIKSTGRALVVRDCVEAIALQESGRRETVAVVQSPITAGHTRRIAEMAEAPAMFLSRRDGRLGVVASSSEAAPADEAFASRTTPNGFVLIHSHRKATPPRRGRSAPPADPSKLRAAERTRLFILFAAGVLGAGVPIGLLLAAGSGSEASTASALNVTIVGLVVFYLLLAFGVARFSARTGAGSGKRRMRLPWIRGSGEVQPSGWTFHGLEEIVVGAALVSAVLCIGFLLTIGGFLG